MRAVSCVQRRRKLNTDLFSVCALLELVADTLTQSSPPVCYMFEKEVPVATTVESAVRDLRE